MDLAIFCDSLSVIRPPRAISAWKFQSSAVARHFVAPLHPCISACGVDKNYLKWQEIQLAMNCIEGSLIDLE